MIRLLPFAETDGATNMAADETLVRSAADGIASLRFYRWTTATVSLGYFQPASVRLTDPLLAPLPFVRRPSGGATLVHHHEITYALALPQGRCWQAGDSWLVRMHRIISRALGDLGVPVLFMADAVSKHGDVLCFQQFAVGDVLCHGKKVVGSAQRKFHQALMQHGSILLAQSEHASALPGIRELTGISIGDGVLCEAVRSSMQKTTPSWRIEDAVWTEEEMRLTAELAADKYSKSAWNEKR
ncbi:MAG TPA: lipoate--protein ligase family protein [Gemmataceae bacterium]|nr:lipoate--protein ligase family protein [Gemmataceae bacterium]